MNTIELRLNCAKIKFSKFKDSEKKKGLKLLIEEYSKQTRLAFALSKEHVTDVYTSLENGTERL